MYYCITDLCVACSRCAAVCKLGAPHFDGKKYSIDPEKCVGCGACAPVCPQDAIVSSEYQAPPAPEKIPGVREESCDVVVIGSGPAGLAAAASLGEKGYSVTVLETARKPGGAGVHSTFYKVFDSKWELDAGGSRYMDEYVRVAMTYTKYQLRASFLRTAFEANTEFFDWFCTFGNAEEILRVVDAPKGKAVAMKMPTGQYMVDKLIEHCAKVGATIRTCVRAKELLMEDGKVVGVLAEDAQGDIAIRSRSVLVATGNMCQAHDLADFLPEYAAAEPLCNPHRSPTATGDGVRMIRQAGIPVDFKNVSAHYLGAMPPTFDSDVLKQGLRPEGLRVNKLGERFVSEGADRFDAVDVLLNQPGCVSYNIIDSAIFSRPILPTIKLNASTPLMMDEALPTPGKPLQYVDFMGLPVRVDENGNVSRFDMGGMTDGTDSEVAPPEPMPDHDHFVELSKSLSGIVCVADTLEELAAQMGADPEILKATVARYNELCDLGRDLDFEKHPTYLSALKQGPFYAIKGYLCSDGVFGGVFVDDGCRVVNGKTAVPGLYAAGDLTSGNYIKENSHRTEAINDFTWANASGFLAGKSMDADMSSGAI